MATPAPIYASSPGLLVSKNPAATQVVLLPPASTIAGQLIVRDASGTASIVNPIVVSTTQGALFTGGLSTFYINTPYAAFATAALSPSLYMPLYASSFQPTFRYGTESNFTPQYQYISSAYNPASFNALSSTALYGTLVNGAPLFTTADPAAFRFQAESLSTGHISTADLTVDALYTAASAQTTSSYSAYLSAGVGLLSSLTTDSMTVTGPTILQSTLRTAGSLQVGGNFSMAGPAVFADVSANGYWSTLGTIGIGGDVSGATVNALASTIVGGAYSRGAYFVSAATVAATLSTVLASASTAVYSGGLGVGLVPGTALSATVDISGGAVVSGGLVASGISTSVLSSATAVLSSATLRDINTPYSAYDLKVQGGFLYVGGNSIGGGGISANFIGNSFTASNYLYGTSTITSTFTVGSTIVNPDFNVAVYGDAHSSSIKASTISGVSSLWVAVGTASTFSGFNLLGQRGSIKYSWNGSNNWSNANFAPGFLVGQDVAWNGRMWVAVGTTSNRGSPHSTIQWSLDGSNWSNCRTGGGFNGTAGGWGISWNGRMWIATGHDLINHPKSTIQYSYDGSNFQAINNAVNFLSNDSTYGNVTFRAEWNGRMWIAGRPSNTTAAAQSNACYSYDGLNWSNLTISTIFGPVSSLHWNGRYWLAMGIAGAASNTNDRSVSISSNGFNWLASINNNFGINSAGSFTLGHAHRALWNGSFWIGVGLASNTGIQYSYDGLNWIQSAGLNRGSTAFPNGAVFDCFQTGTTPERYYLPSLNYDMFGGGRGISWNGSLYIATGYYDFQNPKIPGNGDGYMSLTRQTIQYSTDGIVWSPIISDFGFGSAPIAYTGGIGVGCGNAVAWQSNCQTDISLPGEDIITSRTQQTYASTIQIYSLSSLVTFGQTLFVDSANQTAINSYYSALSTQYMFFVDGSMLTYGAAKQGGAATWTAVSDERVKQDIVNADISACYYAVRGLHVHNFKYKDDYIQKYKLPSKPRYGLYAEEVEPIIPEAVINTSVLGEPVKMLDMEPVNMLHYGATAYMYSTLKHHTSTIAGGHTYITAAGPLNDISGAFHTSYANRPALLSNLTELYAAHASNYQ